MVRQDPTSPIHLVSQQPLPSTGRYIPWLRQNFSNVRYAQITGVGHLLHLEDRGQTPVLTEMMAFLERIPK